VSGPRPYIHPQSAFRWFRAGKLPVPAERVGGLVVVGDLTKCASTHAGKTAIYAPVFSAGQKSDLDGQVAGVTAWAASNGYSVDSVVTEVGSALDGKRRKFLVLVRDWDVTTIIVERRDRFAGFGAECVAAALDVERRRMVVVDDAEVDDDLVRDMTDKKRWGRLFVSFSCLIEDHPRPAPTNAVRAGVDLGIWVAATIADPSGDITEV